jgi:hypothetical protein
MTVAVEVSLATAAKLQAIAAALHLSVDEYLADARAAGVHRRHYRGHPG